MAVEHGYKGSVYFQTGAATFTKVANTTAWTLNYINELAEARIHEETHVRRFAGMRDWNASVEGLVDQELMNNPLITRIVSAGTAMLAAATAVLRLRLNTGNVPLFQGACVITDIAVNTPADGLPTVTMNAAANGALTFKAGS